MSHIFNPGNVSNHLFPDPYGKSIRQSVWTTPNVPGNSTEALDLSMANRAFLLVQPQDQLSNTAFSKTNFNDGIGSRSETVGTNQTINLVSNQGLSNRSIEPIQQTENSLFSNNQLLFNQLIPNPDTIPILPISSNSSFASEHP